MSYPKIIFLLVDGIGDLSQGSSQKTILQSLSFPTFNSIAYHGFTGLMDPVETGLACGSDTAHLNILGYNPFNEYRGRGSFETLGSGLPMDFDEIGFKCNFAYMNEKGIVEKRRVDRKFPEWGVPLIDFIHGMPIVGYEDYKLTCVHATEHRCAIKISGKGLSSRITSTDPLKDGKFLKKVYPKNEKDENARLTSKIINSVSEQIYKKLMTHPINIDRIKNNKYPANIILLRGCGSRLKVQSFEKKHNLKSFMIAPTAIINGLGQTLGMDIIKVKGATGDYSTDLIAKADALIENITKKEYDFGFLHIKAVDDAGHDKSFKLKCEFLEKIDGMTKHLISKLPLDQEFIFVLTGDHTTPIRIGDHTFEPVPFAITSVRSLVSNLKNEFLSDSVEKFNEIDVCEGDLGRFSGFEVMEIIKSFRKLLLNK